MKNAEEWFKEIDETLSDNHSLDDCQECLRQSIKEIQLDAWKAGVSYAALVLTDHEIIDPKEGLGLSKMLLDLRDNKKEI